MSDDRSLHWPFYDERHRALATSLDRWAREHVRDRTVIIYRERKKRV